MYVSLFVCVFVCVCVCAEICVACFDAAGHIEIHVLQCLYDKVDHECCWHLQQTAVLSLPYVMDLSLYIRRCTLALSLKQS